MTTFAPQKRKLMQCNVFVKPKEKRQVRLSLWVQKSAFEW